MGEMTDRCLRLGRGRVGVLALALILSAVAGLPAVALAGPGIKVTPVANSGRRGHPWLGEDAGKLAKRGYVENEFFIAGAAIGAPDPATSRAAAPYKTRMLVRRPVDPEKFNGTVVVEWFNVSSGYDLDVVWPSMSDLIMRDGYAYVGVSAQPVGLVWLNGPPDYRAANAPSFPAPWDPDRYAGLTHPGAPTGPQPTWPFMLAETYSFDVFTHAGRAIRGQASGTDPMGGLKVKHLVATGQSQSSMRLSSYINDGHQGEARVYDGFILVTPPGALPGRSGTPMRAGTKIIGIGADVDMEVMGYYSLRNSANATNPRFRLWEVPGAGHTPGANVVHQLDFLYPRDLGSFYSRPTLDGDYSYDSSDYVIRAALHHMHLWIANEHDSPPPSTFIDVENGAIKRDRHGNALGGVRLPYVEVPTASYGTASPSLWHTHVRRTLADHQLAKLYPKRADYVSAVNQAIGKAQGDGYLLAEDADTIRQQAEDFRIPAWQ